jgi:YxiJ-like protein
MNKELLVREIKQLREKTAGPFPYDDLRKMRANERLIPHFKALGDDDWLAADLNTYFMCVEGIASHILHGVEDDAPKQALQWLALGDFFEIFPTYRFLENEWEAFSQFARIYQSIKRMQEIELAWLLSPEELLALKQQNPCQGWQSFLGPVTYIILDEDDSMERKED